MLLRHRRLVEHQRWLPLCHTSEHRPNVVALPGIWSDIPAESVVRVLRLVQSSPISNRHE